MRVLIIEDDKLTAEFIETGFTQAGFTTVCAYTGTEGLFKAKTESFDIAVIDIMLPELHGFEVIKQIRKANISFPIIVLSARGTEEDKIRGLEAGADDYQTKPFSIAELLARANAKIRRASSVVDPTELGVADLRLNMVTRKVFRGSTRIFLQPLEFQLLEYLMRNTGRVVSKTTIMEHVWEYNFDPHTNVVESRMSHLRDKIDKNFQHKLLKTIRGFGYVLE